MSSDGIGGVADGVLDPLIGRSQQARTVELIDQAGPDGVLVDRHGRAVYYSIHSNDVFGQFIASNHLQDPKALRAFDPKAAFPVGSMTLKAAWKVVQPGETYPRSIPARRRSPSWACARARSLPPATPKPRPWRWSASTSAARSTAIRR
ncbi:hypothetical protein NG825_07025 [Xanthomonas sacchari]|nr:hypothetical protein NG825_07025 [Xanthomonas sacchari]